MKDKNTDASTNFFSDDPEENLRIENEILHLKLKAECGGELMGTQPLPPDLENQFLKNILELEHAFVSIRQVKIFDFLDKPFFKKSNELNDLEIETALENLCALMESKNIMIDFSNEYNSRLKYNFITEELFEHQTNDIQIPSLITHFIYEEFHPNHHSDIESRAIEFIESWLNHQIDEDSWELAPSFILPDGTVLSKQEVLYKINTVFASYPHFCDSSYSFAEIKFELKEKRQTGIGYAAGFITYTAVMENGENVRVEGPFKICLSMEYKWWSIFYFVFPGFNW